jgi:hypothetical protein
MKKRWGFCLGLATGLLFACGGSVEGPEKPEPPGSDPKPSPIDPVSPDPDPKPDPEPEPEPPPLPEPPPGPAVDVDLTGSWASRVVNSQCFDGTLGQDTVQITTLSLIRLSQQGLTVDMTTEVCSVELSPYLGNVTSYPPTAVAAIHVPDQTVELEESTTGALWEPSHRVSLLGWEATGDPTSDPLPQEPDDPRVIDADRDGHPGVTLNVDATIDGDVYIANRNITETTGVIMSEDLIQGASRTTQAQNILDSSPALLRFNKIQASPNPDAGSSNVEMVRIGDTASCEDLLANAENLFSAFPTIIPCPF